MKFVHYKCCIIIIIIIIIIITIIIMGLSLSKGACEQAGERAAKETTSVLKTT